MKTKRLIAALMALCFIFSLASCGTFVPANTQTNTNTSNGQGGTGDGEVKEEYSEDAFTAILVYNGQVYNPAENDIVVYWNDGKSIHSSKLNSKGIAGAEGLDGDYRVTVSGIPEKLAYNPNAYMATNDQRNLVINIYDVQKTSGKGLDPYKAISLSKTAVYQVTLNSQTHIVYFEYRPTTAGRYTIESWMDTTAELYNPYCDSYNGTFAAKYFDETIDGGGAEGIYTKNFLDEINVSDHMIGNVLTFGVHVDAKNASNYPVTVTFVIQLNGGFEGTPYATEYDMYVMQEEEETYLAGRINYGSDYKLVTAETPVPEKQGVYSLDENNYKLWTFAEGGDNFYHVYNPIKYPETNGYGPILYFYVSQPCQYLDRSFTNIEQESKPLSVKYEDGTRVNYKHFIEGYTALATRNEALYNGGSYYCSEYCECHEGKNTGLSCTIECQKCHADCRRIKKENIGFEGLQAYANQDGLVAVTEEVKTFLYNFSICQRYFADGEGWCETTVLSKVVDGVTIQYSVDSNDASQWLFACAYYEKIN